MLRLALVLLIVCFMAVPVMAEPAMSPLDVESIPFSHEPAAPNTDELLSSIDMHSEVEGGEAHGKAGLPQFDTTTFASQLFWLAISFVVLYVFFAKSSLPKISSTIEDRRTYIQSDLEQADSLSAEAEETRQSYEQAMSGAHDDARLYVQTIMADIQKTAESDAAAFREKSEAEVKKLDRQADLAKEKIKGELADTAYTLTQDIIAKLTSLTVKDADIQKAVMDHMESTPTTRSNKKIAA